MKKPQFMKILKNDRKAWESILAAVDKNDMTGPVLPSGWSIKDIIAHVAWYEDQMVGMLETNALAGSDWWNLPMDERNELIYKECKDLPLDDVLAWAEKAYARFSRAIEPLSEEALNDPSHFEDMPPDWFPWKVIAGNTYDHYRDHIEEIEDWLSAKGK
jgi:hypothetical protein